MAIKQNFKTNSLDYVNKENIRTPNVASMLNPIRIIAPIGSIQSALMEIETTLNGFKRTFKIPLTCLSRQETTYEELLKHQYLIAFVYINSLRIFLVDKVRKLQEQGLVVWEYTGLGYYHHHGKRCFLLGETTLPDGSIARYHDSSVVFSRGASEDYRAFIGRDILGATPTQLALAIGMASPIVSRLKDQIDVQTIIFNVHGPSSTGKTTIAQFIASLWGEARVSGKGIVRTFNSTVNALTAGNEGINGVPIVLDDLSGSSIQDKTQFVYTLAQGEPKARSTTSGKLQPLGDPWSGVIIITSETPLLSDTETRQGLLVRVIDSQRMVWTQSSEHAESIKRFIANCHGHLGKEFTRGLDALEDYQLLDQFHEAKKEILAALPTKDNLTLRIVNKLAVIHMTSGLIKSILGIELNRQAILNELVLFDQANITERNIGFRAYEAIKLHIINSYKAYEVILLNGTPLSFSNRSDFHARIEFKGKNMIVTYPHQNFKKVLQQAKIFEYEHVLDYFAANKLCEVKERNRRSIKHKDFKTRVIRVFIHKDQLGEFIPWYGKDKDDDNDEELSQFPEEFEQEQTYED